MTDQNNPSLWEQFSKGVADAVADIREKVVEEPMYGRALDVPDTAPPQWPQGEEKSFAGVEQSREIASEPERGMDR